MKYAVVEIGTKQYKVQTGDVLEVQKMAVTGSVVLDRVLLVVDGDKVEVGTPTVPDARVFATYIEDKKGDKVEVFKYKSKSKYRKMRGARQTYSYLKIDSIGDQPNTEKAETPKVKKTVKADKVVKLSSSKKTDRAKSRTAGKATK